MTPEQALNILIQAAQLAPMPAQAHAQCQQAVQVLSKTIDLRQDLEKQKEALANLQAERAAEKLKEVSDDVAD